MAEPILELRHVTKRFGRVVPADDVSLAVEGGEFFTFLGPSGSGKSTLLRIVAGLEHADAGQVLLRGRDVGDVPPWRRHLGMVFQQYANFPHMNVAQNVAYGLRRRGLGRAEIRARVLELLELVGLFGFEERRVTQLSGGEQQRVAIARALAPRPELLLLDEPLAALDEKIRREMQGELTKIQEATGTTFVYVTHDQEEALTMSDRIAVLNRGRCVQIGAPERIFRFPRTRFVAGFFRGCNVLDGRIERDEQGAALVLVGRRLALKDSDGRAGTQGVAVRGESVLLGEQAQGADLVLPAVLDRITYRGVYHDYRLRLDDGQALSATLTQRLPLAEGSRVEVGIRADEIVLLKEDEDSPLQEAEP
jgi:ABC-type Fe3+/spermidine/putrescine transport system ATPase subunit